MPVEMVGRDIQNDADIRLEAVNGFKLKTGQLQYIPLFRPRHFDHRSRRGTDVAADLTRNPGFTQDMSGQRGRGRFSVRPGDADRVTPQEPRGQLQLTDYLNAARTRVLEQVEVGRNAGRDHRQVRGSEGGGRL